jgi:hypothetical protein
VESLENRGKISVIDVMGIIHITYLKGGKERKGVMEGGGKADATSICDCIYRNTFCIKIYTFLG